MAVKKMGKLGVSVRKMKALTLKMETVTLNAKVRQNLTCFLYQMYAVNSKIFFLADVVFWGGHLRFG
jgi:hypothetical protein